MRGRILVAVAACILVTSGLLVGGAVGTPASAAAPATSGTIVYLDGHNIWLMKPNGTGRYRVTSDGTAASPYMSPSMSDGGIIAAGKGLKIVRMRQNGTVLNRMDPGPMLNSVSHPVDGPPVHVAISPDGTKIAYTMVSYSCPVAADCLSRAVTGVTSATSLTGPAMKSYYWEPSWVTNSRLMVHGGFGSQVMLQDGSGGAQHWFDDSDHFGVGGSTDLGDAALSRNGQSLVAVRGYGSDKHLINYRVVGDPRTGSAAALSDPQPLCSTGTDGNLGETSWSPDGTTVVTAESGGIVLMVPGQPCAATAYVTLGRGSEPFWSPAGLAPGLREFGIVARPSISGQPRVGRRLTASPGRWSPSPAKVRIQWMRNGRAIKGATAGRYVVRRIDRRKRLAVRVTVTRTGYRPTSATSPGKRVR